MSKMDLKFLYWNRIALQKSSQLITSTCLWYRQYQCLAFPSSKICKFLQITEKTPLKLSRVKDLS